MRNATVLLCTVVILGSTGLSTLVCAQEAGKINVSGEKGREGSAAAVSLLDQAMRLVSYARDNESPMAMLAAVEMIRRVQVQDGEERLGTKATEADQKASKQQKGKTPATTLDTKVLLGEAKAWAKDNPGVLAIIEAEMAKPAPRGTVTMGRKGGPIAHVDQVKAKAIDT